MSSLNIKRGMFVINTSFSCIKLTWQLTGMQLSEEAYTRRVNFFRYKTLVKTSFLPVMLLGLSLFPIETQYALVLYNDAMQRWVFMPSYSQLGHFPLYFYSVCFLLLMVKHLRFFQRYMGCVFIMNFTAYVNVSRTHNDIFIAWVYKLWNIACGPVFHYYFLKRNKWGNVTKKPFL